MLMGLFVLTVSKLFRAYGLYNKTEDGNNGGETDNVSKLFRAYGLYNLNKIIPRINTDGFKALSSLRVI